MTHKDIFISSTMDSLTLTHLPDELLVMIISHTLPEGFESFCLTNKKFHALCEPFIQNHNALRARFEDFDVREYPRATDLVNYIRCAGDLIILIAKDPVVARYIKYANLSRDGTHLPPSGTRPSLTDLDCECSTLRLFAHSPYLKQAGIDWQEFYNEFKEDYDASTYSQVAAAFLLTLLPNVETLKMPQFWQSNDMTERLVSTIATRTREPYGAENKTSLAKTVSFELIDYFSPALLGANFARPFLNLQSLRYFCGPSCVEMYKVDNKSDSKIGSSGESGNALVAVTIRTRCMDEEAIADFLQDSPGLRILRYFHNTQDDWNTYEWNMQKFTAAIEQHAGNRLEELSLIIPERFADVSGRTSLHHYPLLKKLELSFEIVAYNMMSSKSDTSHRLVDGVQNDPTKSEKAESILADLIPPSVCLLSLQSDRWPDKHDKALRMITNELVTWKKSSSSMLEEVFLTCEHEINDAFKEQCEKLRTEAKKVGVRISSVSGGYRCHQKTSPGVIYSEPLIYQKPCGRAYCACGLIRQHE